MLELRITKPDATLSHQVFRKETYTEQYIHVDSHHHPSQKLGVINTLSRRALKISNKDHIDEEQKHLIQVFMKNGYNCWVYVYILRMCVWRGGEHVSAAAGRSQKHLHRNDC